MTSTYDAELASYLTAREVEVLTLVAAGFSAKEIAQQIAIAPRTVERHIDNARMKMHARNRAHLVTRAIASGLLNAMPQLGMHTEFMPTSFMLSAAAP